MFHIHPLSLYLPFQVPFSFPFIPQTPSDLWKAIRIPASSYVVAFIKTKATTEPHKGSVMLLLLFECLKQGIRNVRCTQRWQNRGDKTKNKYPFVSGDVKSRCSIQSTHLFWTKLCKTLPHFRPHLRFTCFSVLGLQCVQIYSRCSGCQETEERINN
jgi:hypothetical protein